jgi:hypothetical protein
VDGRMDAGEAAARWSALFGDLEAQADALAQVELEAELRDRVRREGALVRLADRLAPSVGRRVQLHVLGAGVVHGRLSDVGVDWLLLAEDGRREVLVPAAALLAVTGAAAQARAPGSEGEVARRLDLRWVLRRLARDRAVLSLVLREGSAFIGRLDRVGADHVELAEGASGEPYRSAPGRSARLVPLDAVALLRRS